MKLMTKRLTIRLSTRKDTQDIHAFLADPTTMTFFVEGTYSLTQVSELLKNNETEKKHYSIVLSSNNQLIGKLSFHPWFMDQTYEIGWIMHPDFTHQGYMTEAVEAMLDYGFDTLKLHRIIATCQPENLPSKRLCERYMRLEGHFKKCIHVKEDLWWDELFYAVLNEEYKKKNNR